MPDVNPLPQAGLFSKSFCVNRVWPRACDSSSDPCLACWKEQSILSGPKEHRIALESRQGFYQRFAWREALLGFLIRFFHKQEIPTTRSTQKVLCSRKCTNQTQKLFSLAYSHKWAQQQQSLHHECKIASYFRTCLHCHPVILSMHSVSRNRKQQRVMTPVTAPRQAPCVCAD